MDTLGDKIANKIAIRTIKCVEKNIFKGLLGDEAFVKFAKEYAFFRIRIEYLRNSNRKEYDKQKEMLKAGYLPEDELSHKAFMKIATEEFERLKNDPTSEYND